MGAIGSGEQLPQFSRESRCWRQEAACPWLWWELLNLESAGEVGVKVSSETENKWFRSGCIPETVAQATYALQNTDSLMFMTLQREFVKAFLLKAKQYNQILNRGTA